MIVNSYTINLNFGKDKIFLSIRYFFIHQEGLNVIFAILSWLMANSFWLLLNNNYENCNTKSLRSFGEC